MAQRKKGVQTQGTQVWILHGDNPPILTKMQCIKTLDLGDDSPDSIDDTCLDEKHTKTSQQGLMNPSEGSMTIDTDPHNASHLQLLKLADEKALCEFYIGWSESEEPPILDTSSGDVTLPESRCWSTFTAIVSAGSPKFEANSLVNQTIQLKRQTKVTFHPCVH